MYTSEIKKAARISHNSLDSELERLENYARAEIVRAGVPSDIVSADDNDLIENAIITKVLMEIGPEKTYANSKASWEYQLDCLRKHDWTVSDNV